jgi:hypothetical protein
VALATAMVAPSPAGAVFTRPFVRQLTEAPLTAPVPGPLIEPYGVAVAGDGDVYVTSDIDGNNTGESHRAGAEAVDQFDKSGNYVSQIADEAHFPQELIGNGLAIDSLTGNLYLGGKKENSSAASSVDIFDGSGVFSSELDEFSGVISSVAVDNSTETGDPNAGDVYVAEGSSSNTLGGVYRFSSSGTPINFTGTASYIKGNVITGDEHGPFGYQSPWTITTDRQGNIYVAGHGGEAINEKPGLSIAEFNPQGIFVRELKGPLVNAIASDPTNEHILVSTDGSVEEFDSTGKLLNVITGVSPDAHFGNAQGIALDSEGDLYVADAANNAVDEFGPGRFLPNAKLQLADETHPTSATLNGVVDPEGIQLTDCHFEYVTASAFETSGFSDLSSGGEAPCVPAPGAIPADASYHAVHAAISGLTPGVAYRYRLAATSDPSQLGGTADSESAIFTTPDRPSVDATSASNLSASFVDLDAQVNPLGADTTYHFEYVDAADYEAALADNAADPYAAGASVPTVPADIGAGGVDASVSQQVGGLQSGTTYHFRVVASNEVGETDGPDTTFTTLPAPLSGLADGREYELVTPTNKGDAEDMFSAPDVQKGEPRNFDTGLSSNSGDQFLLLTTAAFEPSSSSGENGYVFQRGPAGWNATAVTPSSQGVQSVDVSLYDPTDFSMVGFHDLDGSKGDESAQQEINQLGRLGGPYATISATPGGSSGANQMEGASADLSHVVLASPDHLLAPGDEKQDPESTTLYEWSDGHLGLVNVDNEGELVSKCGAVLGQQDGGTGETHNAVSADGSKIFFTAPDPFGKGTGCWEGTAHTPQLYVRENGTTTVPISAPPGASNPKPAVYVGASNDGSRVFFLTATKLTVDDRTGDLELYEYNTDTGALVRVSRGESGEAAGEVTRVVAVAPDGSAVYFIANGRLTSDAPSVAGAKLYRFDTETETTAYIATVSESDYPSDDTGIWARGVYTHEELGLDSTANWYTTPDGRYLVFASVADITGYDNSEGVLNNCPTPQGAGRAFRCVEIYRYDAVSKSIACVSCNPTGQRPSSNALFARSAPHFNPAGEPPRPISDDGSYVFFDTSEALVPQDTNGTLDVYEWHDGTLSLVSSGTDSDNSYFLDSSPDGANVFFGTHAQLVPADTDNQGDLYDARICTSAEPCVQAARGETAQCEGDACQAPSPAPIDQSPASLSFSGSGNVVAAGAPAPKAKPPLTRAQKLAAALKACTRRSGRARARCKTQARKRYDSKAGSSRRGPVSSSKEGR